MKKQLTEDITRYDDKMVLKFDKKTFKAAGIGLLVAVPVGILIGSLKGSIPALMIGSTVLIALFVLQIGTIQGMPLLAYLSGLLKILFCPGSFRRPYTHDPDPDRLTISPDMKPEQKERRD